MIRLQRYLVEGGKLSRREAEERIAQGRVTVNGTVAELGTMIDPDNDRIKLDMETVRPTRHHIVLVMHKPKGVVCSEKDPEGRRNANSLLPDLPVRVHTIGRLDIMSEGLLLFTNDGDLTRQLTQSGSGVERVYEVKIQGGVPAWAMERIERGVNLEDGRAKAASCKRLRLARTNEWLEVVMTEGRYREVRRMFQTLGMNVLKLKRVRFGPIRLGKLPAGASRILTPDEVTALTENRPPKPVRPPKNQRAARGTRSSRAGVPERQGKPAGAEKPERTEKAGTTRSPDRPARTGRTARPTVPAAPSERSQLPGHATPPEPGFRGVRGTRPARPARPEATERRPRTLHGGTAPMRGRPETARGRSDAERGRPDASRGRPEAPRGRPEATRGRPAAAQGRPELERRPPREPARRFDAGRDSGDEDYVGDSGAAARRFEAEVADAVRKAAALKGARPATRIDGTGQGAPDRGHAASTGAPRATSDRGAGRGPGRGGRTGGSGSRPGSAARPSRPEGRPDRTGSAARPSRPEGRPDRSAAPARPSRPAGRLERSEASAERPARTGRPAHHGGRPAKTSRSPAKPVARPKKPSGKPQRSLHANKPQKV